MTTTTPGIPTQLCAPLQELVAGVRRVVAERLPQQETADRVAALLSPALRHPGLLQEHQCAGDAECYTQHVLHVEPDGSFSVVALVWLPGQATCIHDHVSWCVVGTYVGEEEETTYRLAGDHLVVLGLNRTPQGVARYLVPPAHLAKGG